MVPFPVYCHLQILHAINSAIILKRTVLICIFEHICTATLSFLILSNDHVSTESVPEVECYDWPHKFPKQNIPKLNLWCKNKRMLPDIKGIRGKSVVNSRELVNPFAFWHTSCVVIRNKRLAKKHSISIFVFFLSILFFILPQESQIPAWRAFTLPKPSIKII